MNKIDELQIKSLFKQLEYLLSEIEWKEQYLYEKEIEFLKDIEILLSNDNDIKSIYENRYKKIESIRNMENTSENVENVFNNHTTNGETNTKIKSIFREIVKKTHPDKISDNNLNNKYIESTKFYESGDIFSLYKICSDLNIPYEIDIEERDLLESKINKLKGRIKFMENSYTWNYFNTEESDKREDLLKRFIIQLS